MTRLILTGPPMPHRGEERFFDRRQADDACAWALASGVAIHGDLDEQDGGRPLRVLSQLPVPAGLGQPTRPACPPRAHRAPRLPAPLPRARPDGARPGDAAAASRLDGGTPRWLTST
jgi:hypothetical protein